MSARFSAFAVIALLLVLMPACGKDVVDDEPMTEGDEAVMASEAAEEVAETTTEATEEVAETNTEAAEEVAETNTEAAEEVAETNTEAAEAVTETNTEAAEAVTETNTEAAEEVAETNTEAAEEVAETNTEAAEEVAETNTEAAEEVAETTTEAAEEVAETNTEAAEEVAETAAEVATDDRIVLTLSEGKVTIDLFEEDAPNHAENFKKLVREGFYDGLAFHRVIEGFMAQGGDPKGDGTGGPGYRIPAEIKRKHVRGSVAAARLADRVNPNRESSGSQFYICFKPAPFLDGGYTVFGQVVEGMETVDKLKRVKPGTLPKVEPDKILKMELTQVPVE